MFLTFRLAYPLQCTPSTKVKGRTFLTILSTPPPACRSLCETIVVMSVSRATYVLPTIRRWGSSLLRRTRDVALYLLFLFLTSVMGCKENATACVLLSVDVS